MERGVAEELEEDPEDAEVAHCEADLVWVQAEAAGEGEGGGRDCARRREEDGP